MMGMVKIKQQNQNIDIEKRPLQLLSSSRSRSIISLVTIVPRCVKGRNPRKTSLAVGFADKVSFTIPRRASSDSTRPAVLRSRRASSLAACKTSSSISSVVLMHLMIDHQNSPSTTKSPPLPQRHHPTPHN